MADCSALLDTKRSNNPSKVVAWYFARVSSGGDLGRGAGTVKAKLSPEQVADIVASSETNNALSALYGVSPARICQIRRGEASKELKRAAQRRRAKANTEHNREAINRWVAANSELR